MKYRERDAGGVYRGGPMYYIKDGLGRHWRWLAALFAVLGGLAAFGIGNIAQTSEIAGAMSGLFGVPALYTGIGVAVVVAAVVLGGVKRIGQVTSYLVPFMSVFYILAGLVLLALRIADVPAAFAAIVRSLVVYCVIVMSARVRTADAAGRARSHQLPDNAFCAYASPRRESRSGGMPCRMVSIRLLK